MKAMIFAAGYGQRLRPTTDRIPKALVPVAGRPMIEYPLLLLKHHGIKEILINLHHLGDKIAAHLGDGKRLGLEITYSEEPELLDTGGGLLKAKSFLADETFVVINTDVLIDLSLRELLAYHFAKRAAVTLVLRPDAMADQFGSMETHTDGRICRFLDARLPASQPAPGAKLMFTGVQVVEPQIFKYMVEEGPFSITRTTYPRMLLGGEPLYGFVYRGFWFDLGTAARIQEAEQKLRTGEAKLHYL